MSKQIDSVTINRMLACFRVLLPKMLFILLLTSTFVSCKETEEPETHGFVCVQVLTSSIDKVDTLVGASTAKVTLDYGECLTNFYMQDPGYKFDEVQGQQVLEQWVNRLCTEPSVSPQFSCEITSIDHFDQFFIDDNAPTTSSGMTIEYQLNDTAENADTRKFVWGPIPLETLTGCAPQVRLTSAGAVQAFDDTGTLIWRGVLTTAEKADAGSPKGGCIKVNVEAVDP